MQEVFVEPSDPQFGNRRQQSLRIGMARRIEHIGCGALRDDFATQHHRDALRDASYRAEIVGNEKV